MVCEDGCNIGVKEDKDTGEVYYYCVRCQEVWVLKKDALSERSEK